MELTVLRMLGLEGEDFDVDVDFDDVVDELVSLPLSIMISSFIVDNVEVEVLVHMVLAVSSFPSSSSCCCCCCC